MMYEWTVKLRVSANWVADGFELDDERALEMLAKDLSYANMSSELAAEVVASPDPYFVQCEQGYVRPRIDRATGEITPREAGPYMQACIADRDDLGWAIFDTGSGYYVQKDDSPENEEAPRLESDDDAIHRAIAWFERRNA